MPESVDSLSEQLFNKFTPKQPYAQNDKYQSHLLDQYKLYVEMADRISARRQSANSYFLTINTALVGFVAHVVTKDTNSYMWIMPVAGIVISFLWYCLIRSYRNLNTIKFNIIHAIEKQLPMSLYDTEWKSVEQGKNPKLYLPFTHIETGVPWIFILVQIFLFFRTFS